MIRHTTTALVGAASLLALTAACVRCDAQRDIPIYSGDPPSAGSVSIGAWGSGDARAVNDSTFTGSDSIKITTHGPFQGARIVFASPIDLSAAETSTDAYLQFIYTVPERASAGGMGMGAMGMSAQGYMQQAMQNAARHMGNASGGGKMGSGGYGQGGAANRLQKPKAMASFRVILVTDDGKAVEQYVPLEGAHTERDNWKSVAIPVAAIAGLKATDGKLKEIRLFGDNPAILYLGQVRVMRDDTPIHVDDIEDRTVAKNDTVSFTASADAGASPVQYDWTVQGVAARDGDKEEVTTGYQVVGEGRVFKHTFVKGGDYTITLTVSDLYGLKKAVSKSANIHVTL